MIGGLWHIPRNIGRRLPVARIILRNYKVLALESSCDDSCLALLQKMPGQTAPVVLDEMKRTLNSQPFGGIIPTHAHEFHQKHIGNMLQDFCAKNGLDSVPPDLICCTRGPGMVGSLSVSLQLAKGLAIAWNKPLIGVNHMLGHILVSKLTSTPQYPFLSLLVSGGHTMLVHSKSISDHEILIDTCDIAVGDSIDKCARQIGLKGNLLGKELEEYVDSIPECVKLQLDEISTETRNNEFNFQLKLPLRGPHNKAIPDELQFTFAPFLSTIQHYMKNHSLDEGSKQFIAYKTQNHLFEHIIDRVNVALEKHGVVETIRTKGDSKFQGVRDLVFSGGVASNKTFRKLLQKGLNTKLLGAEPDSFSFHFPDISLCTDNAVMIGVAGIDIFENLKIKTDMSVLPIRKWPMNELLTVDGWIKVSEDEVNEVTCK